MITLHNMEEVFILMIPYHIGINLATGFGRST